MKEYQNCREFLECICTVLEDLRDALTENDEKRRNISCASKRVMGLDAELREAASKLEDSIESQLSAQILSQSESDPIPPVFSIDLREIHDQLQCFLSMVQWMKGAYEEEDDDEAAVSPPIYFDDGDTSKVVGFADLYNRMKWNILIPKIRDISICGMAGIGKTRLVKKILEDRHIKGTFISRIFVAVGLVPKVNYESQFKRILRSILAQANTKYYSLLMSQVEDSDHSIWDLLNDRRTLIVLDDVWSKQLWNDLRRKLPNKRNGCTILVTTRSQKIHSEKGEGYNIIHMRFMNKEESWDLLRRRVFGEKARIPYELVKAGKKIAKNCEGLPLLLIAVANLLSDAERTLDFWSMVAAVKENHIFVKAYDQISEVLLPSFYNLPQKLKPCFLYMRVFPQNHQFRQSRLVKLLNCEDFLDRFSTENTKDIVRSYFRDFYMIMSCWSTMKPNRMVLKFTAFILAFGIHVKNKLRMSKFFKPLIGMLMVREKV